MYMHTQCPHRKRCSSHQHTSICRSVFARINTHRHIHIHAYTMLEKQYFFFHRHTSMCGRVFAKINTHICTHTFIHAHTIPQQRRFAPVTYTRRLAGVCFQELTHTHTHIHTQSQKKNAHFKQKSCSCHLHTSTCGRVLSEIDTHVCTHNKKKSCNFFCVIHERLT